MYLREFLELCVEISAVHGNVFLLDLVEHTTVGSGVVRDSGKSEVVFLDRFRVFVTMGNPIIERNFGVFRCRIFKNRNIFGEKIEKSKNRLPGF